MRFTIYRTWEAERLTVKEILRDDYKYQDCLFIEDWYDDPWKYNEEYFMERKHNKKFYVLSNEDVEHKLENHE